MNQEIQLPFQSAQFKEAWNEWIEYRKERRLPKYVPRGLSKTFSGLIRDSDNNDETAVKIIEQSIEKNYQGLFPLKNNYGQSINSAGNKSHKPGTSEARIAALKNWGTGTGA